MLNHEHFRELSALAAVGQLSSAEDRELNGHLRECAGCRAVHAGYLRVIQNQLPQADVIRWKLRSAVPGPVLDGEIRERFFARARAAGIDFGPEAERPRNLHFPSSSFWPRLQWQPLFAMGAMAVVAILGIWISLSYQLSIRIKSVNNTSAQFFRENEGLRTQLAALQGKIEQASAKLEQTKRENSVSAESLSRFHRELEEARARAEMLAAGLEQSESRNAQLASADQQKDTVIADLRTRVAKLHGENADNLSTVLVQEARIRDLTESLQQQTANLERESQLMAVTKDVRQLMGARNLHIIDVHDVDGEGRSTRAFGRVFYAEAQALIFYAFDLPSGKLSPAKYTFQAWGQREYFSHSVRNLGTFEVDDREQRRWVLKVNDPALLNGIDSVFVTTESLRAAKEPHGEKILYAYVAGQPNHP